MLYISCTDSILSLLRAFWHLPSLHGVSKCRKTHILKTSGSTGRVLSQLGWRHRNQLISLLTAVKLARNMIKYYYQILRSNINIILIFVKKAISIFHGHAGAHFIKISKKLIYFYCIILFIVLFYLYYYFVLFLFRIIQV